MNLPTAPHQDHKVLAMHKWPMVNSTKFTRFAHEDLGHELDGPFGELIQRARKGQGQHRQQCAPTTWCRGATVGMVTWLASWKGELNRFGTNAHMALGARGMKLPAHKRQRPSAQARTVKRPRWY